MIELKTGDVILYRRKTFLSKAIQWFEKNKWSHAGLVVKIYGSDFVEEAEAKGLLINTLMDSIKKCEIMLLRPKFNPNTISFSKLVIPMAGKHRYNFIKLLFVQVNWQLFHIWLAKKDNNDKLRRVICGEFVAYVYHVFTKGELFKDWFKATSKSLFESDQFEHINL